MKEDSFKCHLFYYYYFFLSKPKQMKALVAFLLLIFSFSFANNFNAQSAENCDTLQIGGMPLAKVEVEASFPGSPAAWTKYITKYIQDNATSFKRKDFGSCVVRFIADKRGHISDVEATNMKKSKLAKLAVEAIENGPKWIPAQQNGRTVNAYRLQPITLSDPGK